jgi:hypothetical protein
MDPADACVPLTASVVESGGTLGATSKTIGAKELVEQKQTAGDTLGGVSREVHVVKGKEFTSLGDEAEQDTCRWVPDTGA